MYRAARNPWKCDMIIDVKLFLTVYLRIYLSNFLTLSNQMLRNKIKCIRMSVICYVIDFNCQYH